jgi:hypothetical protein
MIQPWRYERSDIDTSTERRLLAQVIVAKVTCSRDELDAIMQSVPVYQIEGESEAAKSFNCVSWARAAFEKLRRRGAVTGVGEWSQVDKLALEYMERKKGQDRWGVNVQKGVPTLDLLSGDELVA